MLEITNVVKRPVWLIIVFIAFFYSTIDFFLGSIPLPIVFPPFQCISFSVQTKVGESLLFVASLGDSEIIMHLKNPFLQVLHMALEFYRWLYFVF